MKVSTRALMLPFPELIPADGLGMKMQWRRRHSSVAGNARENMSNNKQAVTSGTSRIMFKIPSDSWKTSWRREDDRFFHRIWLEYVRFHMGSLLILGSAIHLRSAVHYQSVHQRKLPYISCFQVQRLQGNFHECPAISCPSEAVMIDQEILTINWFGPGRSWKLLAMPRKGSSLLDMCLQGIRWVATTSVFSTWKIWRNLGLSWSFANSVYFCFVAEPCWTFCFQASW